MQTTSYPTRQHERLAALIGTWEGPIKTWFDPDSPVRENRYKATIRAVAGGHAFLQEYESSLDGEAFSGVTLYAYDDGRKKIVVDWVDSFHSIAPMHSEGDVKREAVVDVLGSYTAGDQTWGWRTVLQHPTPESLIYRAYNVLPDGQEYLGIEATLSRAV
ncbi:MAG: DUF1579 family protein [Candidatus Sericytochromatia bacterium]|nr:DUF1579 family protein [Candidatus Tanganyikabacteria bacterium]